MNRLNSQVIDNDNKVRTVMLFNKVSEQSRDRESNESPNRKRLFPITLLVPLFTLLILLKPVSLTNGHTALKQATSATLSILFVGDIMQHMPQVEAAWNDSLQVYHYDTCFQYVKPILSSYDLTIANLETTLAGRPFSGYPAFSSPDELVSGMQNAGIDIVGTANNHCCDRGYKGIARTVKVLDSLGMKRMGTYTGLEDFKQRYPLIYRKNRITLAILNYTYGTNGIPVPEGTIVNLIEKDRILKDLESARSFHPDKVIIFIHWGVEYQREPNDFQKDIASYCFTHGADLIIGSHPHVIQPMEWMQADSLSTEKLVVWSLGNYVSNQRNRFTDGGAMVGITFRKEFGKTRIESADYQLTWVYTPMRKGKPQYFILPVGQFENDSAFMEQEDLLLMKRFAEDSRELLGKNQLIREKARDSLH